ncbi:MAG: AAA family ATPase, partial [Cyanobacteria bacterium J06639_16]
MLISLRIENFALIDQLDLQLKTGLNVLTGETGAGKSIILDAIDAVLGGKASQRLIRSGEQKALLEATFVTNGALQAWLSEQKLDIPLADHLVCTRELTTSKGSVRSRSRLNGVAVNKPQIEDLRRLLVEITAQGQTMQLGTPSLQLDWLDGFGGKALHKQRQTVAIAYSAAIDAQKARDRRRQAEQQRLQQLDLFEYQCQELSAAHLEDPNELTL